MSVVVGMYLFPFVSRKSQQGISEFCKKYVAFFILNAPSCFSSLYLFPHIHDKLHWNENMFPQIMILQAEELFTGSASLLPIPSDFQPNQTDPKAQPSACLGFQT